MPHDFKKFPELTNSQMELYYWDSPHKQIFESFEAEVVKVTDGDTIKLRADFRDFDFSLRFMNIAAPELKDADGLESKGWLESQLLGKTVDIVVDPTNRVEKWGRLLGYVMFGGVDMGNESVRNGYSKPWENRNESSIPSLDNFVKSLEKIF